MFAAGLHWGTFAVGGSDSYCYVHQADRWASGRLQPVEPLALDAPWPEAPRTFAPAGHTPSPTVRGAAVPICPAGLSIVMAPFRYAGGRVNRPDAVFLVVPLFGALLIWGVYLLGSRVSPTVGLASAVLAACSPAFLFQLVQPMSDVPAAAFWVLAVALAMGESRSAPLAAGLATSAAILIRPNLLPLGLVIGLFMLLRGGWKPALTYAAASAPGCLAVAVIQQVFYGSPLRSGYGALDGLFALEHVVPNATRYAEWMWQTHTPAWLLSIAAPFLLRRRVAVLLLSLVVVNVVCYLPYAVFNDWWYLRFLLPAIAISMVLMVGVVYSVPYAPKIVTAAAVLLLSVFFIREARARQVFDLPRLEARYERAGTYVATHLPPNALVITSWESGSVRFYGGRQTLVWDALDPAWLDRAIAYVRMRGLEPYLLFERWEEPAFRQRFSGSDVARLDWPPAAEIGGLVRIYRPDDRQRYLNGTGVPTDYVR